MFSVVSDHLNRKRPFDFLHVRLQGAGVLVDRAHVLVGRDEDPDLSLPLDRSLLDERLELREAAGVVLDPLPRFVEDEEDAGRLLDLLLAQREVVEHRLDKKLSVVEVTALGGLQRLRDLFGRGEGVRRHGAGRPVQMLRVKARVFLNVGPGLVRERSYFRMQGIELSSPIDLLLDYSRVEDVRAVPARLVVLREQQARKRRRLAVDECVEVEGEDARGALVQSVEVPEDRCPVRRSGRNTRFEALRRGVALERAVLRE